MKKKTLAFLFSILCVTTLKAEETSNWHGYFGMGGEVEQGKTSSPDNNGGFGKIGITLAEFSLWNTKYQGYSIWGKIVNMSMTNEDLKTNGSNGYLVEVWPTYRKAISNKSNAWIAIPFKSEQYSKGDEGETYSGYNSFGIAPGIDYNFSDSLSTWAKVYYKYDVQTSHSNGVDDNFLESEINFSYKISENLKLNAGYLYKVWEEKDLRHLNAKKKNIDENVGKFSLNVGIPKYELTLTPFLEVGGYYDEFYDLETQYLGKYNERDSYKFGFYLDKKINESWKVMGEFSLKKQKVDSTSETFNRDIYFGKVIVAYTF